MPFGDHHAVDVFGARLVAHEHDLLAPLRGSGRLVGGEVHLADGGSRRRREARGEDLADLRELRVQHRVEVLVTHSGERLFLGDLPLGGTLAGARGHVDRHLQRGGAGALADAGLQHPELALVDRELGVAHVAVVRLEAFEDGQQFVVDHREVQLHVVEIFGVADARHHVFALRVDEEVAVGLVLAGRGVASEADAGAGVVVTVAEHHRLDVDRRAQIVFDLLAHAVRDRTRAVPTLEHRLDRTVQLVAWLLGERCAGRLLDGRLVVIAQRAQHRGRQLVVRRGPRLRLGGFERVLEQLAVDAEHDPAVHGDEATVRVERESLVVRHVRQTLDALVVQAQVEDGVHHSGHRELRAGSHAHEQRVVGISELATHRLLELEHLLRDLLVETVGPSTLHVRPTRIGRDREARRYRQLQHARHFGEVGALSTQEILVLHGGTAVLVIEGIDVGHDERV